MHDPKVANLSLVASNERKPLRVFRPRDPGALAVVHVLLGGDVGLAATARVGRVAVVRLAVRRELNFLDVDVVFGVVGFIAAFPPAGVEDARVVLPGHHPEIVMLHEDHGLAVR